MDRIFEFIRMSFNYEYRSSPITVNTRSNFISKDCFQHLLYVDISKATFEVPIILRNAALYAKYNGYSEICMPIMNNNVESIISRRTVSPIMRDFLNSNSLSIQAIITSKGERYYGCPGLILDQDYNPLLVLTCEISNNKLTKHRCRISNDVFSHQDKLIEKTIFKKILPTLAAEYASFDSRFDGVFVGNINLIVKPIAPTPNKDVNKDINKFLIDNIGDII